MFNFSFIFFFFLIASIENSFIFCDKNNKINKLSETGGKRANSADSLIGQQLYAKTTILQESTRKTVTPKKVRQNITDEARVTLLQYACERPSYPNMHAKGRKREGRSFV